MPEPTQYLCPKCGARLTVERVDHQLSGQERLICPRHGAVGHLAQSRERAYSRHRDSAAEDHG